MDCEELPPQNEDADDLIVAAQDHFFDGNLTEAISSCEKALALSPRENDAYELIIVALFLEQAKSHKNESLRKILTVSSNWSKNLGEKPKPIVSTVKASYLLDDSAVLVEYAKKLCKIRNADMIMDKVLAIALLADSGKEEDVTSLLSAADPGEEALDDDSLLVRWSSLLAWVGLKSGAEDKREAGLRSLHEVMEESSAIVGIGFAYALAALYHLESGNMEECKKLIILAKDKGVEEDNLWGVEALYETQLNGKANDRAHQLADKASSGANVIIKKRLDSKVYKQS